MRIYNVPLFMLLGLLLFALYEPIAQVTHPIHFVESEYQYLEPKSTFDSLILNVQWDFRSAILSKTDSVSICEELLKLCRLGRKSVRLFYWEFEKVEDSQWTFKKRSYELFELIRRNSCFEEVIMTTAFEIIQEDRYDQFPYDNPKRAILFLVDE